MIQGGGQDNPAGLSSSRGGGGGGGWGGGGEGGGQQDKPAGISSLPHPPGRRYPGRGGGQENPEQLTVQGAR